MSTVFLLLALYFGAGIIGGAVVWAIGYFYGALRQGDDHE